MWHTEQERGEREGEAIARLKWRVNQVDCRYKTDGLLNLGKERNVVVRQCSFSR